MDMHEKTEQNQNLSVTEDEPVCRITDANMNTQQCSKRKMLLLFIESMLLVGVVSFLKTGEASGDKQQVRRTSTDKVRVAFIGNSIQYYNDSPRFLEEIGQGKMHQQSMLQGGATLKSLLQDGSGVYTRFHTYNARIDGKEGLYDWGACTVPQLLFGHDPDLADMIQHPSHQYLHNTTFNPCIQNPEYFHYLSEHSDAMKKWDYVVLQDNTANPGRPEHREEGVHVLKSKYGAYLRKTGATPILLMTHAYETAGSDLFGSDIPRFTKATYEGYVAYQNALAHRVHSKPRLALNGIGFLIVWEEDRKLWHKLFHTDFKHPAPAGSFLQGLILYHAIFGKMPSKDYVLREDMSELWNKARYLPKENPFPTMAEAEYLYGVAERVVGGYFPPSFFSTSQ